jgi:hypothetical protein
LGLFRSRYYLVAQDAALEAPDPHRRIPLYDPRGLADRRDRKRRNRLSDHVEDLFDAACREEDADTAAELLTVLENMRRRQHEMFKRDRRISDDQLMQAQAELARGRVPA